MGIERENIVFYGIKDDYKTFYPKEYADEESTKEFRFIVDANPSVCDFREKYSFIDLAKICITDGMNGDYSIFGVLISANGQDRWGEDRDLKDFISIENLKWMDEEFRLLMIENKIPYNEFKDKIGLHTITHYT